LLFLKNVNRFFYQTSCITLINHRDHKGACARRLLNIDGQDGQDKKLFINVKNKKIFVLFAFFAVNQKMSPKGTNSVGAAPMFDT